MSSPRQPAFGDMIERARLAHWRAVAVWGIWVAALALALLGLVEVLPSGLANTTNAAVALALILSTVTVGAVLVTRLPRHIVGWLLLAGGLLLAISIGTMALADYGLNVHPGSVPGAIWFAVVSSVTGGPFVGLLAGFVPLYFPTGHLPSPRWRVVVPIAAVPTLAPGIANLFGPFTSGTYPAGVANPLSMGGLGGQLVGVLNTATTVIGIPALLLVMASLVVRYRRAGGIERQQLKWFAVVGLGVVPAFIVAILAPSASLSNAVWVIALGGLALLPVAIGLAVLRYRLYEMDRIVSRTIAYGALTAIVAALFVGVILALQAILSPVTQSNEVAVAGSTLLVFSLFQPLRRRVQRLVDRRFNRSRYDAERTVAAFADRLRDVVDVEALRAEILVTVSQAVEPSSVSLWLRE